MQHQKEKYKAMKKLIAIGLIALTTAVVLTGCEQPAQEASKTGNWDYVGRGIGVRVVTIKGHDYLVMYGYQCGGIVHSASCPCTGK